MAASGCWVSLRDPRVVTVLLVLLVLLALLVLLVLLLVGLSKWTPGLLLPQLGSA